MDDRAGIIERADTNDEVRRAKRAKSGSPFLTTKEAAFYLARRPYTLIKWRQTGHGPRFRRHGRGIFYHIDDLDTWSKSRSQ